MAEAGCSFLAVSLPGRTTLSDFDLIELRRDKEVNERKKNGLTRIEF